MLREMRLERAGVLLGRAGGKRAAGLGCDPAARGEHGIEMNKQTKLWVTPFTGSRGYLTCLCIVNTAGSKI
jgi:hypothetical protein